MYEEAFEKIIEELKKAKHYIFLEYFIISKGYVWDKILEILDVLVLIFTLTEGCNSLIHITAPFSFTFKGTEKTFESTIET